MNLSESSRLILGLRSKGWSDTEIADFILWIAVSYTHLTLPTICSV